MTSAPNVRFGVPGRAARCGTGAEASPRSTRERWGWLLHCGCWVCGVRVRGSWTWLCALRTFALATRVPEPLCGERKHVAKRGACESSVPITFITGRSPRSTSKTGTSRNSNRDALLRTQREVPEKRRTPWADLSPEKQQSGAKGREMYHSFHFLFYLDRQPCGSMGPVKYSTIITSMETKIKFIYALNFTEV